MATAQSDDLRIRVLEDIKLNLPIKDIANKYKIHRNTLYEWKQLYQETGTMMPKTPGRRKGTGCKIVDMDTFEAFVKHPHDKTISELTLLWKEKIGRSTLYNALKSLGYSHKKNVFSSKQE